MLLSQRTGARLTDGGCFFRVWAPSAVGVEVLVQHGPRWMERRPTRRFALQAEPHCGGYYSAVALDVCEGSLYRFLLHRNGGKPPLLRLDPAGRDSVHSGLVRANPTNDNASIVVDADSYEWKPFTTPRFEDFNIYQLHIGSFSGRDDHITLPVAGFRDAATKFAYIADLGFSAIEPLPVQEFAMDRSWGYNPAAFFAPESAYGTPDDLRFMVDEAHRHGLAVIFDVVYNHAGPGDNLLWDFDREPEPGAESDGGCYFDWGRMTSWGRGPAWSKGEVQDFFYQNARMYFEDYNADGLRFDVTTQIDGGPLSQMVGRLKADFPEKYLIAEHLPAHPWVTTDGRFDATWHAHTHHETQRALQWEDRPVERIKPLLGWDGFAHAWNLVKYTGGSHDDVGDDRGGDAKDGLTNGDSRHRYLVDQLGGVENWHARAKCRLAWALNVTMPCTPMLFMGTECLLASPAVAWGYWHDGLDQHGDHRFSWLAAGNEHGMPMRRLVKAANRLRWENPALRSDSLDIVHADYENQVLAFVREAGGNAVLVVVNLSDNNFVGEGWEAFPYGVATGGRSGQWMQALCTQDAAFGGWDGAGNAYHDPWTQEDGRVWINLPKWSVVALARR